MDALSTGPRGALIGTLCAAIAADDPDGVVVPYLLAASTDNKSFSRLGIAGYGFAPLRVPDDVDTFGLFHAVDERVPDVAASARMISSDRAELIIRGLWPPNPPRLRPDDQLGLGWADRAGAIRAVSPPVPAGRSVGPGQS